MRNFLFLLLIAVFMQSCQTKTTQFIASNDPLIEYSGRIDFTNPLEPRFSYSGVSIRFCAEADSVSIVLDDNVGENFFALIIDQAYIGKIQTTKGSKCVTLAKDLTAGAHEFELVKATEEMFGKVAVKGIYVRGKLRPVTNRRPITIEFIGNSITCGYGNEGKLGETFGPTTQNHYLTYAAITAHAFNANPIMVCRSGIGIYRNYDGPVTGNVECMPNFYDRIYLYDSMPKYSFTTRPDLVCINLGTNDFSTTGCDTALYINAYLKFIDQIQSKYDHPDIICLAGPMMEGAVLDKARNCIQFVVNQAKLKNKGYVSFFEMSHQTGDLGIGVDYHPTVEQNILNARELIQHISELKNWVAKPMLIKADAITNFQIRLLVSEPLDLKQNQLVLSIDGQEVNITKVETDPQKIIYTLTVEETLSDGQVFNLDYLNNKDEVLSRCKIANL